MKIECANPAKRYSGRHLRADAAVLVASKKYEEAESYLQGIYDMLRGRNPVDSFQAMLTGSVEPGNRMLLLYQEWGKPEKVAEWRQRIKTNTISDTALR